jgi:hypothetical protein
MFDLLANVGNLVLILPFKTMGNGFAEYYRKNIQRD